MHAIKEIFFLFNTDPAAVFAPAAPQEGLQRLCSGLKKKKEAAAALKRQITDGSGVIQYMSLCKFYSGCLRKETKR